MWKVPVKGLPLQRDRPYLTVENLKKEGFVIRPAARLTWQSRGVVLRKKNFGCILAQQSS